MNLRVALKVLGIFRPERPRGKRFSPKRLRVRASRVVLKWARRSPVK